MVIAGGDDEIAVAGSICLEGRYLRMTRAERLRYLTEGHIGGHGGLEVIVPDVDAHFAKAKAAGATVLAGPYSVSHGDTAIVQFPGGYLAEIHDLDAN